MRGLLRVAGVFLAVGCASPGDLAFTTELVDFGPALPGVERTQSAELINRGDSTLVLSAAYSDNSAFWISFPERLSFSPNEVRSVSVHYLPWAEATEPEEAAIKLSTEEGVSATVRVTGTPTTPDCRLPEVLDFGAVARGDTMTLDVVIARELSFVGEIESLAGDRFTKRIGEAAVTFSFNPLDARESIATVRMSRHPLCGDKPVILRGTGVAATLSWTLPTTDFGSVTVGTSTCLSITLSNLRFTPIVLTQVGVREGASPSSVFSTPSPSVSVPASRRDESGNLIAGTTSIEVCCNPTTSGPRAGQLTANTDVSSQPSISVNLRCVGMQ